MKGFIVFAFGFTLCWLGLVSGLTPEGCPHCWGPGTKGRKPFICTTKGQCPCEKGHRNFRCSGCLPGYHPNGWWCCKKTQYHVWWKRCRNCDCDPEGVSMTVTKQCNRRGICTCRKGHVGVKCDESSEQEFVIGDINRGALLSFYCNGKCKIHYLKTKADGDVDLIGSDKPYVDNEVNVTSEGQDFCQGMSCDDEDEECKLNDDNISLKEFHIYVIGYEFTRNVRFFFKVDNYFWRTVRILPDCYCDKEGVEQDLIKPCNSQGICTCRKGYGGRKCDEKSEQEFVIGDIKRGALLSFYCNGKCKIHYLKTKADGDVDLIGSDKPYVDNGINVTTEGQDFCQGISCEDKDEACELDDDNISLEEFHIYVIGYESTRNVRFSFKVDNYLRRTVHILLPGCDCDPMGVEQDLIEPCNSQGICTCNKDYGGRKCDEKSEQEFVIGEVNRGALLSFYCNGKCKIHYLKTEADNDIDLRGSDKPYVEDGSSVKSDGAQFCLGQGNDLKYEECVLSDPNISLEEFHIFVIGFGLTNVKFSFHVENYLRRTVQILKGNT